MANNMNIFSSFSGAGFLDLGFEMCSPYNVVYVNEFLTFRRYALLPDKGTVSREEADRKAEEEYRLFNPTQQINSDFDNFIKGLFENE